MRRIWLSLLLSGCATPPKVVVAPTPPPAPVVTEAPKPIVTGYDEGNLDKAVKPCDDFYQYACGGWLKRTEIPADRSRWGSFGEIDERNLALLRHTLEEDAAGRGTT